MDGLRLITPSRLCASLFLCACLDVCPDPSIQNETQSSKDCIKDVLAWMEYGDAYLSDLPWFSLGFPAFIPMSKIVETFNFIERMQHA